MSSDSFFYKKYENKKESELKEIVQDKSYSDEARLCAIDLLRQRNVAVDDSATLESYLKRRSVVKERRNQSTLKYNTGLRRFVALIIDGIVISVVLNLIQRWEIIETSFLPTLLDYMTLLLPYVYAIVLHGCCGQTIGKMLMGVKLFDKDEQRELSYKQALMRDIVPLSILSLTQTMGYFIDPFDTGLLMSISLFLGFFLLFWSLLEIVTMLFNVKRRALHDYIAQTVVLRIS